MIKIWKESEEEMLIDMRMAAEEQFISSKNHEVLWKKITDNLNNEIDGEVTKSQVINKWKSLKKKFKEVVDANNKSGNEKVEWKYLDKFSELYGHKAATNTEYSFDSGKKEERNKEDKLKIGQTKRKKKTTSTACAKVKLAEKVEEMNSQLLEELRKQHGEKMDRMDKLLNILEKK